MSLYQLVYSSVRTPLCDQSQIDNILESCKQNNPKQDITGVLLHTENHFIQYLEGSKDIIKLYDHIKTDPRHKSVVLLSYSPLPQRVFPSWHMGFKSMTREKIDFLTDSSLDERKVFQSLINGQQQTDVAAVKLLVKFFHKN